MNRIMKWATSGVMAAGIATGAFAVAGTGVASAAPRPAAARACTVGAKNYPLPRSTTSYKAGVAGSVSISTLNSGTIRVAGVHAARGWRSFVDSGSGSSVDVYFHSATHTLKFEAEINDWGGLTVTVTSC